MERLPDQSVGQLRRAPREVTNAFRRGPLPGRAKKVAVVTDLNRHQCLSASTSSRTSMPLSGQHVRGDVTNAFRRGPLPGPPTIPPRRGGAAVSHQCLSAWTASRTRDRCVNDTGFSHGHQCLSAWTASRTKPKRYLVLNGSKSPMPFGVDRFPDTKQLWNTYWNAERSPMPFGVDRFPDNGRTSQLRKHAMPVTNAFRRGPLPGPRDKAVLTSRYPFASPMPFGVDRFPDRSPSPTGSRADRTCHQCLSAWTASRTRTQRPIAGKVGSVSPMPFGVDRFPDCVHCTPPFGVADVTNAFRRGPLPGPVLGPGAVVQSEMSPMPFGVDRFPDEKERADNLHECARVTNAFRRGPLPGRQWRRSRSNRRFGHQCLSAWTASRTVWGGGRL